MQDSGWCPLDLAVGNHADDMNSGESTHFQVAFLFVPLNSIAVIEAATLFTVNRIFKIDDQEVIPAVISRPFDFAHFWCYRRHSANVSRPEHGIGIVSLDRQSTSNTITNFHTTSPWD